MRSLKAVAFSGFLFALVAGMPLRALTDDPPKSEEVQKLEADKARLEAEKAAFDAQKAAFQAK